MWVAHARHVSSTAVCKHGTVLKDMILNSLLGTVSALWTQTTQTLRQTRSQCWSCPCGHLWAPWIWAMSSAPHGGNFSPLTSGALHNCSLALSFSSKKSEFLEMLWRGGEVHLQLHNKQEGWIYPFSVLQNLLSLVKACCIGKVCVLSLFYRILDIVWCNNKQ